MRIIWVQPDCLHPASPAFEAAPDAAAVFVIDPDRVGSFKQLVFQYECLLELPVEIRKGKPVEQVLAFAAEHGATTVITTESADPVVQAATREVASRLKVEIKRPGTLLPYGHRFRLKRFSHYWTDAAKMLGLG